MLDLGGQPPADLFPAHDDPGPDELFPLRMWLCASCGLAQLWEDGPVPEEPRGVEPQALVEQAHAAVDWVSAGGRMPIGATVREYGSPHGGSWLGPLTARGFSSTEGEAEVVIDCFGLMHAADQKRAVHERALSLAATGQLFLQYHSLATILRLGQWNALRHGHFAYYTGRVLTRMLAGEGLMVTDATSFPLYGGTVLVAAGRARAPSVPEAFSQEEASAPASPASFASLQVSADDDVVVVRRWLASLRADGVTVAGYGAASRAVAVISRAGLNPRLLPFVADASPAKIGRRFPSSQIPIVSPAALAEAKPQVVLVFVADLLPEVRATFPDHEPSGGRFALLDPHPRLLDPAA